jgi:Ca-activated chloride channel family protein
LTDGLANVGITAPDELTEHAMELRKRGQSLSTFGVGNDFDEALLQRLSTAGGGNFYYIEDAKQIPDFISSELGEVMARVASRATLEVKASGTEFEMLSAFASEKNGDDLRIFLGDLVAEQDVEVVVRLTVPAANTDLAIGVSLADADHKLNEQEEVSLARVTAQEAEDETPDVYLTKLVAELDLARAHQEAVKLNRAGDFFGAQNVMSATVSRYRGFAPLDASIASVIDQADLDANNYGGYLGESVLKNYAWQASNVTHSRTMTGTARVEPILDSALPLSQPPTSKRSKTAKP